MARGVRLALARTAFVLVAGLAVGLLLLMAPINLRMAQLSDPFLATYSVVARLVSRSSYALYLVAIRYMVAFVCVLVGAVIAWKKADDRVAWLAGALLVSFPMVFSLGGYSESWAYYPAPWRHLFVGAREVLVFIAVHALVLFVFLFPDGRMPLPWLKWVYGLYFALLAMLTVWRTPDEWEAPFLGWVIALLVVLPIGVGAQAYRFRRRSTPQQRQQTKWVLIGLTVWLTTVVIALGLAALMANSPAAALVVLLTDHINLAAITILPMTLVFSIQRYRLWDIDRLIQRSLAYAVLTAALAGLYLGSVVVLQSIWRAATGQAQSQAVTVLSTLIIAAAAGPLRTRVQRSIDRRFNRQRYDAARTVETFSAALRSEAYADLEGLTTQLTGVVQETLEPEKVSLWLRS